MGGRFFFFFFFFFFLGSKRFMIHEITITTEFYITTATMTVDTSVLGKSKGADM